nr:MAG TPA: hypothetical protein [Caudoviricetes sp.]
MRTAPSKEEGIGRGGGKGAASFNPMYIYD